MLRDAEFLGVPGLRFWELQRVALAGRGARSLRRRPEGRDYFAASDAGKVVQRFSAWRRMGVGPCSRRCGQSSPALQRVALAGRGLRSLRRRPEGRDYFAASDTGKVVQRFSASSLAGRGSRSLRRRPEGRDYFLRPPQGKKFPSLSLDEGAPAPTVPMTCAGSSVPVTMFCM
jgi:hypothetical protein